MSWRTGGFAAYEPLLQGLGDRGWICHSATADDIVGGAVIAAVMVTE